MENSTENNYQETDLGNVSPNPRGEYDSTAEYEYLDLVSYEGGSYLCTVELGETVTNVSPAAGKNTDIWQLLTLPGALTAEYVAMHDDVANKAKQVEASTAAAELARQEAESALADVEQLHSDTVSAANRAAESRDSAAGYAQTAEVARDKVKESEENVNAQISNFDTHVAEKTQESEQTIADARQQAVRTVTKQGELSVQAVKDETAEYIEEQKNTAKEEINSRADEKIEEINQAYKPLDEKVELLNEDVDTLKNDTKELNDKKITKFYTSNQGETHITDSDNGKISDMRVYGRSEQKQYRGKNLLPTTMYANSTVRNGIKFTHNGDGSVTVSGTATDITYFGLWGYNELSDKGILPGLKVGDTVFVSDCLLQETNSKELLKITTNSAVTINSSTTTMFVGIKINKNTTINKTYYPQIEKGSEATSYEPYVGGQPSPSLDYPQEIKSVVNPVVKICGKNLLKATLETQEKYGISCKKNNDGTYTFNGTSTSSENVDFYFIGDYYSDKPINNNNRFFGTIGLKDKIDGIYTFAIHKTNVIASGYTSFAGEGPVSAFMVRIEKNVVLDNLVLKPMLVSSKSESESESEEGEFEEYNEHAVTFPYTLNAIPVNSGGNVTIDGQQYISDYVDVERGVIVRNVIKETLNTKNGFENEEYRLELHLKNNGKDNGNAKCLFSKFVFSEWQTCVSGTSVYLKNIKKTNNDTLYTSRELKELCIEFYLIYQLKEPQETNLTAEQARVLKELTTHYPVTNIFVTSEQSNGYTTFNYPVSLENGWNYVKQQLGDNRDYIYNIDNRAQEIDMQSAEAYVNSEYAVALTELEV